MFGDPCLSPPLATWPLYVPACACMCVRGRFEISSLEEEIKLATGRHLSNRRLSLGNDRWRQFESNSEGMSVHAGGQRQSSPLCSLWGSTTEGWIIHTGPRTYTHKNASSQTFDLCICRVAKICQNPLPSCINLFFMLGTSFIFHQLSLAANKSQQKIWWACTFWLLGFWFRWILSRQLVKKKLKSRD